jgi:hypothetical protein
MKGLVVKMRSLVENQANKQMNYNYAEYEGCKKTKNNNGKASCLLQQTP